MTHFMQKRLWRYLALLILPTMISAGLCWVWYAIFFCGNINVGKADETSHTNSFLPSLAVLHSLVIALVFQQIWQEYRTVQQCIRSKDHQGFVQCQQERIPGLIHLALVVLTLSVLGQTMLTHYTNPWAGIDHLFQWSFLLLLLWEVAIILDNPSLSMKYMGEVPEEWVGGEQKNERIVARNNQKDRR